MSGLFTANDAAFGCRIARAIADMALSQADGTEERFYSMSSGIEALPFAAILCFSGVRLP
ncbi:MAG: hypothetical protein KC591_05735 [Gemmatimonadetes bacterium]|nr:hypothetical protein [Gemmatimonadota bacterium]